MSKSEDLDLFGQSYSDRRLTLGFEQDQSSIAPRQIHVLTKFEIGLMERYARLSSLSLSLGIDWDGKLMHLSKSWFRRSYHNVYSVTNIVAFWYTVIRAKVFYSKEDVRTEMKVLYFFIMFCYIGLLLINVIWFFKKKAMVQLYNMLLIYNRAQGISEVETKRSRFLKWFNRPMIGLLAVLLMFLIAVEVHYCSTFTGIKSIWPPLFAIGLVLYLVPCVIYGALLQMYVFGYFAMAADGLALLLSGKSNPRVTGDPREFRPSEIDLHLNKFRVLSFMTHIFNNTFATQLIPTMKYAASTIGMASFVLAIRLKGDTSDIVFLSMKGLLVGVIGYTWGVAILGGTMMSGLWETSCWYINAFSELRCLPSVSFTGNDGQVWLGKVIKSFVPLRLSVGGVYYMEKHAKLTMIDFMVSGAMDMLLATA